MFRKHPRKGRAINNFETFRIYDFGQKCKLIVVSEVRKAQMCVNWLWFIDYDLRLIAEKVVIKPAPMGL